MKRFLISLVALAVTATAASVAHAADKLTLQLQWVTQAQFADTTWRWIRAIIKKKASMSQSSLVGQILPHRRFLLEVVQT